eukprot:490057_1
MKNLNIYVKLLKERKKHMKHLIDLILKSLTLIIQKVLKMYQKKEFPYLDRMVIELIGNFEDLELNEINKFQAFLRKHQYDTDSFKDDMNNYKYSNIAKIASKRLLFKISELMRYTKQQEIICLVGVNFSYWKECKNRNNCEEIFVNSKYNSFKQEILEYGYININDYNKHIIIKCNQYLGTQKVKTLKANTSFIDVKYYDIMDKTP